MPRPFDHLRPATLLATLLATSTAVLGQSAPIVRPPQDEVLYQIMPIAWRDSNLDMAGSVQARLGDFGGLASAESLDYLSYLGVTMVYLQPVFTSPAYHGYQHGTPDTLNPAFGTEAQFLAFVAAAHARGIKVIMDFVAYGISHNSPYFQSAWQNPSSPYDSWLAFTNAANTTSVGYTYTTWNGSQVGFIHWNLDNPAVVQQQVAWARKWLDPNGDGNPADGVDGFRLDHAWASGGEGWGADIDFWRTWCTALRAVRSDVFIFCEQSDWGSYGGDLLVPGAFDAVMTKPWEFAVRDAVNAKQAAGIYSSMAATVAAVPQGRTAVAQTNDHDSDRLASLFASSSARQKVAAAILFTQPFPPNIYYGDEIGMKGLKANVGTDANDIPMREPFKWRAVAGAPMSNYPALTAGAAPPTYAANNDGRSVQEQQGVAGSLLETYRSLIAVRKASPALRRGSYLPVACPNGGVYAFVRHEATETVLVAINLNSSTTSTTLDLGAFTVPAAGTAPVSLEGGASLPTITVANRASYPISLAARSWLIARAALTPPADTSHADIDGRSLPADAGAAALRATQTCVSSLGDNVGELNQLFVRADGDALRVSISGNLPADGTSLDLFIDTDPGAGSGQNQLATAHLPAPPGGLAPLDGTRFDAGFAPDALYYINSVGSVVYVDRVQLPAGAKLATKRYLGSVGLNAGRGVLAGGSNANLVEVALDNTNTLGMDAGSTAGAASATTGFEIRIPFVDLGLPAQFRGALRLAAFLQRGTGQVSNQWLPGLAAGSADLGVAPDLTTVSGTQHLSVSLGLVGDIDGDGSVGGPDLAVLLSSWGPRTSAAASVASDLDASGEIDAGDLAALLGAWGSTAP